MKKVNYFIAALSLVVTCPCATAQSGKEPVPIDEAHFPDSIFRQAVLDQFDANKNDTLDWSERDNQQKIHLCNKGIEDLTGIEYFGHMLKRLEIYGNKIKTIDLSFIEYPEIFYYFDCSGNPLTTLDLSRFTHLNYLNCNKTNITSIKFPEEPHYLTIMNCIESKLKTLDVSTAKYVKALVLRDNEMTSINLPDSALLFDLNVSGNRLVNIDLKHNKTLPQSDFENEYNGRHLTVQRAGWTDEEGDPIYYIRLDKVADEPQVQTLEEMLADADFKIDQVTDWISGGEVKDATNDPRFKGKVLVVSANFDQGVAPDPERGKSRTLYNVRYHYNNHLFNYDTNLAAENQSIFYLFWDPTEAEDPVVTAVTDIAAPKDIVSITYYNLAGTKLSTPQHGINIVVTRYNDGSTTTAKKSF